MIASRLLVGEDDFILIKHEKKFQIVIDPCAGSHDRI
jgi:hypothetical protein